jgi:hypothetical protein
MRVVQACDARKRRFSVEVPSSSGGTYVIEGWFRNGVVACGCKGFQYRGACRHLKVIEERCQWSGLSDIPQTDEQRDVHECPVCGGRTIDTLNGAIDD